MKNKVLLGNILAFLTIIMWDFTYIVGKRLFEILDPVQVIFLRFLLATILFAIISVKEYHKKSIKQEMLFVLIGFILSFYFIFENTGLKITYASNVGFIVALLPIISAMKVINSAVNNQEIAKYFESIKNYNLANKYFVKSVTEDKNEMSKLLLGVMYYNMGNKQDGKKLVQEAQKAGVKEADKVLEDIVKKEAKK